MGDPMTGALRLRAFAKVNYALEVRGVRADGYHDISTILQSISLCDELEIERSDEGFELRVEPEGASIGPNDKNTVCLAWKLLREATGEELPVRVRLRKSVPAGAGLGGGSADAAAALVGLNEMFGLGLGDGELRGIGVRIGADVPFCIGGGTALGEGVGEVLTPLPAPPEHHLVVAKPDRGAETARIYKAYDERPGEEWPSIAPALDALRAGDLGGLVRSLGNDLAPVTETLVPEVGELREGLSRAGALGAIMSGSGTAVYGLFGSEAAARGARRGILAPFARVCRPVASGVEVLRERAPSRASRRPGG
ncbi:4-(cytidine 5'-diphospho)-2-C-methyl-D-erythritol kinase [Rubrobacter marinus]|uniref:4-diphosphocytidyl-2-C-methyl-D-erythritol kinase n=1 Tax=Rubrobacter marinus TaxID=2653852 RepID=A0A6G8PYS8_9ACTN|nr:4-(cytidine 5'-diphospho)-2-C-methyl-D-erythritol kinase [Rubrobacter marinus]QIN79404.1 4-(cytidine 5'-diphospho)-2-C-methyl-D-erythritol kinase [Rubrobacter marinus]